MFAFHVILVILVVVTVAAVTAAIWYDEAKAKADEANTKAAEAFKHTDKAKVELDKAKVELDKAKAAYDEARSSIADARKEVSEILSVAETETFDIGQYGRAQAKIAQAEAKADEAGAKVDVAKAAYDDAKAVHDEAETEADKAATNANLLDPLVPTAVAAIVATAMMAVAVISGYDIANEPLKWVLVVAMGIVAIAGIFGRTGAGAAALNATTFMTGIFSPFLWGIKENQHFEVAASDALFMKASLTILFASLMGWLWRQKEDAPLWRKIVITVFSAIVVTLGWFLVHE